MSALDELYRVQNGVDDVVDTDHNTLVDAVEYVSDAFGGGYNYGNGRDGHIKLGEISTNPTTAPTAVITSGSGSLTGTYYYKYSVYNLSGETTVSNASATVTPSNQNVTVTIPAYATNTNVTGFYLYRSIDNSTYYRVAVIPVEDATNGAVWVDDIPATSGTAPQGSNTTGVSASFGGILQAKSVTISTGQTLTLTSTTPFLIIRCTGNVTISGAITFTGLVSGGAVVDQHPSSVVGAGAVSYTSGGATTYNGRSVFSSTNKIARASSRWMFSQGSGAFNDGTIGNDAGKAGGTVFIAAMGYIDVSNATLTGSGSAGAASTANSGGAGGTLVLYSTKYIKRTSTVATVNGGAASSGTFSNIPAAAGGGGGIIVYCAPFIIGSATSTANGGSGGSSNGSGSGTGAVGGANGGDSGSQVGTTGTGNAGSAGMIVDTNPTVFSIPRF